VPGNAGGQYRPAEDVDIVASTDSAGGACRNYDIELRAATNPAFPSAAYHVEIDGVTASGTVVLPNTGGWNSFGFVGRVTIPLAAGQHVVKIVCDQQYFNLNQIRISASAF